MNKTTNEKNAKKFDKYIAKNFGKDYSVHQEFELNGHKIEILKFPPEKKRPYQVFVTRGLGELKMNVPEKLAEYKLERAELVIRLKEDWNMEENWPLQLLQNTASLSFSQNSYLHWGTTIANDNFTPYGNNTNFCGLILVKPIFLARGKEFFSLSKTEDINFYEIIPLYREEIEFKNEHNPNELLTMLGGFIVNPIDEKRQNVCLED